MTQPAHHPATGPHPATEPTTVSQDFLAAALAALMPLGGGLLVLIGYAWINVFGGILGAGGALAWGFWWHNKHHAMFPKNLRPGSVGGVALLVLLLALIFFASL